MKIKKLYVRIILTISLLVLVCLASYAGKLWAIKIGKKVISKNEFDLALRDHLDLKVMLGQIKEKEKKELLKDEETIGDFKKSFIDEILIMGEAKKKKVYDEKEISKIARIYANFYKKQLILKKFTEKFIEPNISKPTDKEVAELFDEYRKKKEFKDVPAMKLDKFCRDKIKQEKMQIKLMEYANKIRRKMRIIENEEVFNF